MYFFFFFYWRYNPLWVLAFSVILLHSVLSLLSFLHPLIRNAWMSSSISSTHLFLGSIQSVPGGIDKIRESVPYVELYRYNPKHLYPKLNGYGDNGHRKVRASGVSTYCTPSVTLYSSTVHARQRDTAS